MTSNAEAYVPYAISEQYFPIMNELTPRDHSIDIPEPSAFVSCEPTYRVSWQSDGQTVCGSVTICHRTLNQKQQVELLRLRFKEALNVLKAGKAVSL